MKRRNMLKTAAAMASGTLFNFPFEAYGNRFVPKNNTENNFMVGRFGDDRDWFFEKRFGMFVHWGIYSLLAWHEQVQWRKAIPREEYQKLVKQWNPLDFDPDMWLDLMQEAGMEYLTFTTKHHDGFCMWDTKQTEFNTMNTPYKKDILGILANACHKRGIPLCLYYSIVDWHHPNYPNSGRAHELPGPEKGDDPDWFKYMKFLEAQVKELCSNYGEIHGFWWDINRQEHHDPSINAMIRKLQPKAVINDRGFDEGDFGTPERSESAEVKGFSRPTEACQSVGMNSWGYRKDEDYFSDRYLQQSIDGYLSRDANYLLNVGPTAEGIIPPKAAAILRRIGKWHGQVHESFKEVTPEPDWTSNNDVLITTRNNKVYVHMNKVPVGEIIQLKPLKIMPKSAVLLNTGQPIEFGVTQIPKDAFKQPCLNLRNIPVNMLANAVPVIKLEF